VPERSARNSKVTGRPGLTRDVLSPQVDLDQIVLVHLDARWVERVSARFHHEWFRGGTLVLRGGRRRREADQEENVPDAHHGRP
jgi:hypothetical protein